MIDERTGALNRNSWQAKGHRATLSTLLLLLGLIMVTACERADQIGNGPLLLSKDMQRYFNQYKERKRPVYFAIAEDRRYASALYCEALGGCQNGTAERAINTCEKGSGGVPCKIFARGSKIIWQGEIIYE